jgi:cell division septal protein FtsQ
MAVSKSKVKERRALKEEKKAEIKKKEPLKTPFKERHAHIFKYFWAIWFIGIGVILAVVLIQLYLSGQLSILLPKERTF